MPAEPRDADPPWPTLILAFAALAALAAWIFVIARPPTVQELEQDVWEAWLKLVIDGEDRTIADLLVGQERSAAERLLKTFGELTRNEGKLFVLPATVRFAELRKVGMDAAFATWTDPSQPANWRSRTDPKWRSLRLPVLDPNGERVGDFEVSYHFYYNADHAGLNFLPGVRRLRAQDRWLLWLVAGVAAALLLAVAANSYRRRERARRLAGQRRTLELARQMCHELRNGLWAFALEGRNLRHLFGTLARYLREEPAAFASAAATLPPADAERLRRRWAKRLAEASADPATDVANAWAQAEVAYRHIESFSRYLNLTAEELDRNLLGVAPAPQPVPTPLAEVWREARELLEMRLHSLGVAMADPDLSGTDVVTADRRDLVHVFVNLAKNAAEALREEPPPRVVECRIAGDADGVRCEVRNGGPAIPPEALDRLFVPGVSSKGPGRGLGLALVRDLLGRAGADIAATSGPEGTALALRFPPPPPITP